MSVQVSAIGNEFHVEAITDRLRGSCRCLSFFSFLIEYNSKKFFLSEPTMRPALRQQCLKDVHETSLSVVPLEIEQVFLFVFLRPSPWSVVQSGCIYTIIRFGRPLFRFLGGRAWDVCMHIRNLSRYIYMYKYFHKLLLSMHKQAPVVSA